MDEITRQVSRARRRLQAFQFVQFFSRTLLVTLLLAVMALAVPKIWSVDFGGPIWTWSWIVGAVIVALLSGAGMTFWRGQTTIEVAIEIDRRFGLKERVSSSLALSPAERDAGAGVALVRDASRRVSRVEINEKFPWKVRWPELSPLLLILAVVALMTIPDAEQKARANAPTAVEVRRQIHKVAEQASEKFKRQRKQIAERNLKEIADLLLQAERVAEDIKKDAGIDRKKAAIKLNNLARDLEKRRSEMGDRASLKKQLDQLKDLKAGPAEKLGKAMREGDFGKAANELAALKKKLEAGTLSKEEQKKLAEQLEQMQNSLQQLAESQQQKKQDLQKQIDEARANNDLAKAGDLQRQLEALQAQDKQVESLQRMASKLAQTRQQLQNGDQQAAAQQLAQTAQDLQQLQDAGEQLEVMQVLESQLSEMRDMMNCQQCNGAGCQACQSNSAKSLAAQSQNANGGQGDRPGNGRKGEGAGQGYRSEERTDTDTVQARNRGNAKAGPSVITGDADGPNKAGLSKTAAREVIESAEHADTDPLENVRLPRVERDHSNEYFDKLRQGEE